jgi:hypothetical protein
MAVCVEYAGGGPFEGNQAESVLMRRACVGALIYNLSNSSAGGYDEPHAFGLTVSKNRHTR